MTILAFPRGLSGPNSEDRQLEEWSSPHNSVGLMKLANLADPTRFVR